MPVTVNNQVVTVITGTTVATITSSGGSSVSLSVGKPTLTIQPQTSTVLTSTSTLYVSAQNRVTNILTLGIQGPSGGGADSLPNLSDVTITAVGNGEVIQFSGGFWINRTLAEAGIMELSAIGVTVQAWDPILDATTASYTIADDTKLAGIEDGAEANVPSFAIIAVSGQNNVVADVDSDTLTLVAGTGISITTNDATDSITITATGGGGGGDTNFAQVAARVSLRI